MGLQDSASPRGCSWSMINIVSGKDPKWLERSSYLGGLFSSGVHFQRGFNFKQVKYLSTFRQFTTDSKNVRKPRSWNKLWRMGVLPATPRSRPTSDLSEQKRGSSPRWSSTSSWPGSLLTQSREHVCLCHQGARRHSFSRPAVWTVSLTLGGRQIKGDNETHTAPLGRGGWGVGNPLVSDPDLRFFPVTGTRAWAMC